MEIAIVVAITVIIITVMLLSQNKKAPAELVKYSYLAKKQIMTNAERIFYDKLLTRVGDSHYVVPQAHLSMFIDHKVKGQNWRGAFSMINGKSVDFLIVEKATQKPVLAIELDDYTHGRPDRVKRDVVVAEILRKAGVPLQRYAGAGQIPDLSTLTLQREPGGNSATL